MLKQMQQNMSFFFSLDLIIFLVTSFTLHIHIPSSVFTCDYLNKQSLRCGFRWIALCYQASRQGNVRLSRNFSLITRVFMRVSKSHHASPPSSGVTSHSPRPMYWLIRQIYFANSISRLLSMALFPYLGS